MLRRHHHDRHLFRQAFQEHRMGIGCLSVPSHRCGILLRFALAMRYR
jgi:hypothetical protein